MHENNVLQMIDTHRLSPPTTSSSGYHSDLSSTNQSPQSIHENLPTTTIEKKTNKNFSRISTFLRKQYERAKFKLISSKQHSPSITTCSKATSTIPLSYLSENTQTKSQQSSSSIYKRSSFIEPVQSIYVQPLYANQIKIPSKTMHAYYSDQPFYSKGNNSRVNSHSYRRRVTLSNYENNTPGYLSNNPHNYYVKPRFSQNYYPYKYLNKNYDSNQSTYAPLSDFISTTNSAFKPVKSSQRSLHHISEQISSSSDDPCDLEVAQYFHQTPQWSNPNYFDIYKKEISFGSSRKNYSGTLC